MTRATIEPGYRIQLPAEWAKALGLEETAELEKTPEGILIRPGRQKSWDEFFATKLKIGESADQDDDLDNLEVRKSDYLF